MSNNLKRAVHKIGSTFNKVETVLYGDLGVERGGSRIVKVTGREGFVYVRLRSSRSELITAFNDQVDLQYGLPVELVRRGSRYIITGVNRERYAEWDAELSSISRHAKTHTFDKDNGVFGNDAVFISGYQFLPHLVTPFPSEAATNVFIYPYVDFYNGRWSYYGNTGTQSLIQFKPMSGTSLVLISMDSVSGNPAYLATTGSFIPLSVTGTAQIVSYLSNSIPETYIPVGVVRLTPETQTLDWRNIHDVRQHISHQRTGTSSGGNSLNIQDEGMTLGTPGTINFVGSPISVTVSGSVARVFVTGSSGGTWGSITGTLSDQTDLQNALDDKEDVVNKVTSMTGNTTSNIVYLTAKAIYDWAVGLFSQIGHTHAASAIASGIINTARLGSGTASSSTILYGDQTYKSAPTAETNTNNIYRCNSAFASGWTGTVNGAPSGANVTVTTSTGNIASITPNGTNLANMRLFNTTRGNYALISSVSGAVVTLTASAPAGWANGDSLTVISTTVNSGDGRNWVELEVTSGVTANQIFLEMNWTNTTSGKQCAAAPVETFSFAKAMFLTSAGQAVIVCEPMATNGAFAISWQDSASSIILKYKGFLR